MDLSPCLWIKLLHSHGKEVGRGFRFPPSGFFCWLFPTRNISKQGVQEGTLQQFLVHQCGFLFFCFTCIFFMKPFSPSSHCSSALLSCSAPCSCADLLLCSLQLCLSCLGCLKQLVGNDAGYHGGYKENRCAALPHQKRAPGSVKVNFIGFCKFLSGKSSPSCCLRVFVHAVPIYCHILGYGSQSKSWNFTDVLAS